MAGTVQEEALKLRENIDEVYASGKQDEWSVFWDSYQQNGTRTNYEGAFDGKGWDDNNFKPKYDIINIGDYSCSQSFRQSKITDLKGILEKQKVEYNTKGATRFVNTFQACDVTRIPTLYLDSCSTLQNCFTASTISEIELHNLQENCTFINSFNTASKLSSLLLENSIIGCSINLQWSPLSVESTKSILLALKDFTGTGSEFTCKVTFLDTCWANLDAEGNTAPNGGTWRDYANSKCWNI